MLRGAAGYFPFFVAPSFGLAPELPGATDLVNGLLWLGVGAAAGFLSAPRPARDKAG